MKIITWDGSLEVRRLDDKVSTLRDYLLRNKRKTSVYKVKRTSSHSCKPTTRYIKSIYHERNLFWYSRTVAKISNWRLLITLLYYLHTVFPRKSAQGAHLKVGIRGEALIREGGGGGGGAHSRGALIRVGRSFEGALIREGGGAHSRGGRSFERGALIREGGAHSRGGGGALSRKYGKTVLENEVKDKSK